MNTGRPHHRGAPGRTRSGIPHRVTP